MRRVLKDREQRLLKEVMAVYEAGVKEGRAQALAPVRELADDLADEYENLVPKTHDPYYACPVCVVGDQILPRLRAALSDSTALNAALDRARQEAGERIAQAIERELVTWGVKTRAAAALAKAARIARADALGAGEPS